MRHPDNGTLRRLCDEPFAIAVRVRQHCAECARCQARLAAFTADALHTADLLSVPAINAAARASDSPDRDLDSATALSLARVRRRVASAAREEASRPQPYGKNIVVGRRYGRLDERIIATMQQVAHRRLTRPVGAAIAATGLAATLALTPAGALAQSLLTVFEPQQVVAVPVSFRDLRGLPDLQQYGTMSRVSRLSIQSPSSLAAASSLSGLTLSAPSSLPAGTPSTVLYRVVPRTGASFTFSAAKAAAAASAVHKVLPAMPTGLDGSTLQATIGPIVIATYGGGDITSGTGMTGIPNLIVIEAAAPRVTSTGVSARQIEDYLLEQPGVSPALASAIRDIGDPTTTLPIPIPVEVATSHPVQVQGVQGIAIGDNTGIGSGVVWQKNGMVYAVAGPLTQDQDIAVANSLVVVSR